MNTIKKLLQMLNNRIEFLDELFILSSFSAVSKSSNAQLFKKHYRMEQEQMFLLQNMLSCLRVDQTLKMYPISQIRECHRAILLIFSRISPSCPMRKEKTGVLRHIMDDCIKFFASMSEKNIVALLKSISEREICNQTTVLYVLLEVLFKYLRIKALNYIERKLAGRESCSASRPPESILSCKIIPARASKRCQSVNSQQNRTIDNNSFLRVSSLGKSKRILTGRRNYSVASKMKSRILHYQEDSLPLKSKKTTHPTPNSIDLKICQTPLLEKERSTINWVRGRETGKNWYGSSTQVYLNMFMTVFKTEWHDYLDLTLMQKQQEPYGVQRNDLSPDLLKHNSETLRVSRLRDSRKSIRQTIKIKRNPHSEQKIKDEWGKKNFNKLFSQTYYRNQTAFKELEDCEQKYRVFKRTVR